MKVQARQIERFIQAPPKDIRAVLVFGPDEGLVRERSLALCRTVVDDVGDPFQVVELEGRRISEDPALLADEATAVSMTGGMRLVRLSRLTNRETEALRRYLEEPAEQALVVADAGDLPPGSLRKLFEGARNAAAVACYPDDQRSLVPLIRETMTDANLSLSPEAQGYLVDHLGSDRAVSRQELAKLVLYAGEDRQSLDLEDVVACIGDSSAQSVGQAIEAAMNGNLDLLRRQIRRAFNAGESPIGLLRGLQAHLRQLHQLAGGVEKGENIDALFRGMRPPIRWPRDQRFRADVQRWRRKDIERALLASEEAEALCKTTDMPAEAICERAYMRVAIAVKRAK